MSEKKKQTLTGLVKSDKMDKTVVVEVSRRVRESRYKKYINRRSSYKAHDENNECRVGDVVSVRQCRPLSKTKSWALVEIVERAAG